MIFDFWKVGLKTQYFTSSLRDLYENWHVLPRNLVPTYSSIILNLNVWLSRKCGNKSVGVRKIVRYMYGKKQNINAIGKSGFRGVYSNDTLYMEFRVCFTIAKYENAICSLCETSDVFIHAFCSSLIHFYHS